MSSCDQQNSFTEDFEEYGVGDDPLDWYDSASHNSMWQSDSLLKVFDLGGNKAFGTESPGTKW